MNGVVDKWHKQGKKWVIFFQDTNPLSFRCYPALLGVTVDNNFQFNSVAVSRKPGQAVGAIVSLINKTTKNNLTINVEYNQVKGLFAQKGGEEVDEQGYSKYPGNINSFVISLERYHETLTKTKGVICTDCITQLNSSTQNTQTRLKPSSKVQLDFNV